MGLNPSRIGVLFLAAVAAAVAFAAPAGASELIDRNASGTKLAVRNDGKALLTYRAHGQVRHVLVWGAINARQPNRYFRQVEFKKDYSGGWGTYRRQVWRNFRNTCRPYDGPELAFLVTACKAADGSYWAVQSWQRSLPALGFVPWLLRQRVWELRLAHWTGSTANLEVWLDWVYDKQFHHMFGRLTYMGKPVYGFKNTLYGAPTDGYGRNLYLDTYNSAYGQGWRRENGFLAHRPTGIFCYGFYGFAPVAGYDRPSGWPARRKRPRGNGEKYRISIIGPGVTPDIMWEGDGLPNYDANNPEHVQREEEANAKLRELAARDKYCRHY